MSTFLTTRSYLRKYFLIGFVVSLCAFTLVSVQSLEKAFAATTFTVDTVGDTSDNNLGDSNCDDGSGECSLRAALQEANALAGTDTIEFGIAPFNGSVKTILPNTELPNINDTVIIDGYTQDDATPNNAISPNPFNGDIRIEIDGTNAFEGVGISIDGLVFDPGSENSEVRGVAINSFSGTGIAVGSDGLVVQGTYIGCDATGLVRKANTFAGINSYSNSDRGEDVLIGGLDPADRNIISGNGSSGVYPGTRWTHQGNYIGLGATGVVAVPNSSPTGAGGFSIDDAEDVVVGGTSIGAANVFSGNENMGIAPDVTDGLIIQGNYIGTDYTGTVEIPNGGPGINLNHSTDVLIGGDTVAARNIISSNDGPGIYFDTNEDVVIQGNYIGTDITGTLDFGNSGPGISSGPDNVNVLIGGSGAGEGNVIAFNVGVGIATQNGTTIRNAFLGNSLFSNVALGIDNDGDSSTGVTSNDVNDIDVGANDRLNFPEYTNVVESGGNTTVYYRLDVPAGDYRIEFFSNTAADSSGNGEGETYLGFTNISHGGTSNENFVYTLASVTGVTNLAMTTTERNVGTPSTFGATSEFSSASPSESLNEIDIEKSILNPGSVAVDSDITYRFDIVNNGPDPFDLSTLTGLNPGQDSLVLDIAPPEITYVSENGADVSCTDLGPGSASFLGTALANHSDYALVNCGFSGVTLLTSGDTFTFEMVFHVEDTSDLVFTNYGITTFTSTDPDDAGFSEAFFLGLDVLDELAGLNSNLGVAQFPVPVNAPTPTTSVVPAPGALGLLSATGTNPWFLLIFSLSLGGAGVVLVRKARRRGRLLS